jgi:hypothetical protein
MLDDAFLEQEIGDVADAETRRNVDDLVGRQRTGGIEAVLTDKENGAGGDG